AWHERVDSQQNDQEEELELEVKEERDEYDEGERAEQKTPIDIEALERFLGQVGEGRCERDQDNQCDFPHALAVELHCVFPDTGSGLFEAIIVEPQRRLRRGMGR